MKKAFITTSLLTLLVSATFAQDYSYDANGVYTDTRGFTVFDGLTLDNVDYSGMTSTVNTTLYAEKYPVVPPTGSTSTAPSVLGIYNGASISNSNFSGSQIIGTSFYDQFALYVDRTSTLNNVNFSNSTFSSLSGSVTNMAVGIDGNIKDVNFSNSKFSSNGNGIGTVAIIGNAENLDFSASVFDGGNNSASVASAITLGMGTIKNINISNSTLNSKSAGLYVLSATIDSLTAHNVKFVGIDKSWSDSVVELSSATVSNMDFRGSTVNVDGKESVLTINNISNYGTTITNAIMSDGTIVSYAKGDKSKNLGLVLAEGETFKISKYEPKDGTSADSGISAKLTVDSTINGGTIIFDEGETLEIIDATLTLSGDSVVDNGLINVVDNGKVVIAGEVVFNETEFLLGEGVTVDNVLTVEEGSTIVIAGCTNEEAEQIFGNMFVNEAGETLSVDTSNYIIKGGVIPEPSTYAAIFGALALAFVAYRKRK